MIHRTMTAELVQAAAEYPAVTLLGPRQSGKTTLVRLAFPDKAYASLEDPDVRLAAELDPRGFLGRLGKEAILDEVQRLPELLSYIQGIVDRDQAKGQFILTGSHQPGLHEAISQSLAGRTAILELWPFSLAELRNYKSSWDAYELIVRGGFPRLHQDRLDSRRYFNNYLQTYIERDVRALAHIRDLPQFQKFVFLLAGRLGQLVNLSSLGDDLGVSGPTIRNWLGVMKASFVVFELPPFFSNISKRVIKSPKIYFTDVGLAAFLLGIHTPEQAARDPLRGSLYENLIIAEIMKGALNRGIRPELYFFRDASGNEVDCLIRENGSLVPVEIKSSETFSKDFLKGINRFKALGVSGSIGGAVLYNGTQPFDLHEIKVFNPLQVADLWSELTGAPPALNPSGGTG